MAVDWKKSWDNRNQNRVASDVSGFHNRIDPLNLIWGAFSKGDNNPLVSAVHGLAGPQHNIDRIQWRNGDEEVYRQMDKQQWDELANKQTGINGNNDAQRAWIEGRKRELASGAGRERGTFFDYASGQSGLSPQEETQAKEVNNQKSKEEAFQKWRQDTMMRLDDFSKQMNMPVEELIRRGDLGVRNAESNARSDAGSAAFGAGLSSGGVSSMNTQRAVTDAQSRYQLERAGLGLNATNSLMNNMSNMGREQEDIRRYEQGMNMQLQQTNEMARQRSYAEGAGRQSNLFGIAGGVLGAMYGGPLGRTAGATAGYQLGSGLGRATYGEYKPTQMSYPTGNTRYGGGLSGGRNPYGGSQ